MTLLGPPTGLFKLPMPMLLGCAFTSTKTPQTCFRSGHSDQPRPLAKQVEPDHVQGMSTWPTAMKLRMHSLRLPICLLHSLGSALKSTRPQKLAHSPEGPPGDGCAPHGVAAGGLDGDGDPEELVRPEPVAGTHCE